MNAQSIALVIGSILGGGGLGALITKIWNQKRLDSKQNVNNFQALFNEISKDVGRVRDEQAEERKIWAEERKQWAEERKIFNSKIDKLNELIRNQDKALHAKEIEVTKLQGQVNLLQSQLDTYREVHTASKNVTIKT